ncbi:hypothetical protein D3C76_1387780 [compost metagenome]
MVKCIYAVSGCILHTNPCDCRISRYRVSQCLVVYNAGDKEVFHIKCRLKDDSRNATLLHISDQFLLNIISSNTCNIICKETAGIKNKEFNIGFFGSIDGITDELSITLQVVVHRQHQEYFVDTVMSRS